MPWFKDGKPVVERLTKTLAHKFQSMKPCPGDRPLSERREDLLREQILKGSFRSADWSYCYCEETKEEYRVNGKHTSTLFMKIYDKEGGAVEKLGGISVVVHRFTAATLEDVADLYSTFDTKGSSRTIGDINASFAHADERLAGISPKIVNLSVSALAYNRWGEQSTHGDVTQADRAHHMLDNVEIVLWLNELMSINPKDGDPRILKRVPVVSAMVACYKRAQDVASAFWRAVRDASDPDRNSITRVLNRFLMQNTVKNGAGAGERKKPVEAREMYDKCIHSWNAYRGGRSGLFLKWVPEAPAPKAR